MRFAPQDELGLNRYPTFAPQSRLLLLSLTRAQWKTVREITFRLVLPPSLSVSAPTRLPVRPRGIVGFKVTEEVELIKY